MTRGAERDQVLIGVLTTLTTFPYVMDLQVESCSAGLTSPLIAPQNFDPYLDVPFGIEANR